MATFSDEIKTFINEYYASFDMTWNGKVGVVQGVSWMEYQLIVNDNGSVTVIMNDRVQTIMVSSLDGRCSITNSEGSCAERVSGGGRVIVRRPNGLVVEYNVNGDVVQE